MSGGWSDEQLERDRRREVEEKQRLERLMLLREIRDLLREIAKNTPNILDR